MQGVLLRTYVHDFLQELFLGLATITVGLTAFAALQHELSVLFKLQAASHLLFKCRLRTEAYTDSQQKQLQCAKQTHELYGRQAALCVVSPAYSHIRSQHLDLLQHCCTVADCMTLCELNTCGGFLKERFACRKQILSV